MKVTLSGALPVAGDGVVVSRAIGATFAFDVTLTDVDPEPPSLSVTVKVAIQLPAAYEWRMFDGGAPAPLVLVPSPKLSDHEEIVPSESELPEPSNVTLSGAFPVDGDLVSRAVGAAFVTAVTVTDAE